MKKNEAKFKEISEPLKISDRVGLSAVIVQVSVVLPIEGKIEWANSDPLFILGRICEQSELKITISIGSEC